MNIKLVKLFNSEEIIADVEENKNTVVLKNPIYFTNVNTENGPSMGFTTWPSLAKVVEEGVSIDRKNILCVVDPVEEIKNLYDSKYGSGLIKPESNLIV